MLLLGALLRLLHNLPNFVGRLVAEHRKQQLSANFPPSRTYTTVGGRSQRTSTYLPTQRSAHTSSPVLSSPSWNLATHFLKHISVILQNTTRKNRGTEARRRNKRWHVLVKHVRVEAHLGPHHIDVLRRPLVHVHCGARVADADARWSL